MQACREGGCNGCAHSPPQAAEVLIIMVYCSKSSEQCRFSTLFLFLLF